MGYNRHLIGFSLSDVRQLSDGIAISKLTTLNLNGNFINDDQVKALTNGIDQCKSLEYLELKSNDIGDNGLETLSKSLSAPISTWKSLNISNNKFTSKGLHALSEALAINKTLISIDLSLNTYPSSEAYADFIQSLSKSNQTISDLSFSGCDLDSVFMTAFRESLYHQIQVTRTAAVTLQKSQGSLRAGGGGGFKKVNLSANPLITEKQIEPFIGTVFSSSDCLLSVLDLRGTLVLTETAEKIDKMLKRS